MKKSILVVVFAMVASALFAQEKEKSNTEHRSDRATYRAEQMKEELGLSEEQFVKVKAINEKYADERSRIRTENKETKEQMRDERVSLHRQRENELKAVLTDEQYKKYEAQKKEKFNNAKEKRVQHKEKNQPKKGDDKK